MIPQPLSFPQLNSKNNNPFLDHTPHCRHTNSQNQVSLAVLPVVHAIGCLGTTTAGRFHGAAGRQFVGAHLARQAPAIVHVPEDEVPLHVVEPLADAQHVLTLQTVRLVVQPLGHTFVAAPQGKCGELWLDREKVVGRSRCK